MQTRKHTKKSNKSKLRKPVLITAVILSVALIGFSVYAFALKPNEENTSETDKSGNPTTSNEEQQPEDPITNPDDKTKAPNTDAPAQPTPEPGSNKQSVQMIASVDQSNGTVYIRGGANYPVIGGSCYAKLTGPSGQSIQKDSVVLNGPSSTDCKTIAVPVSELSSGQWKLVLHYTSDSYEGASSEVSFNI